MWALLCITFLSELTCSHSYQESLAEVEEKYKKAMVSNAQLDNDKANLIYQVDTLKDVIEEMEEQMSEMKRELEDKSKVKKILPLVIILNHLSKLMLYISPVLKYLSESVVVKMVCICPQELERQKHTCTVLQHKQEELKEGLRQRDELIEVRLLLNSKKLLLPVLPYQTAFLSTP